MIKLRHDSAGSIGPRGVTLVEVLMSLMIMSIGLASVAVLFPISVLRSVQATQMTNSAILKYNVEAYVQMNPQLIFDPDGDGNLDEHIRNPTESRYIIDPTGFFELVASGNSHANYATLSTNNNSALNNDNAERGFVDWIGNTDADNSDVNNNSPTAYQSLPRYDGGIRVGTFSSAYPSGFSPSSGGEDARALKLLASTLTKQGDGWETQLEALPVNFVFADGSSPSPTAASSALIAGLELPADLDLTGIMTAQNSVPKAGVTPIIPDPQLCRVIVFSADGAFSVSLPLIHNPSGTQYVLWTEDINLNGTGDAGEDINLNGALDTPDLPLQFFNSISGNFEVGRVVLQTAKTQDYNWLLTVRRGQDGQARGVDVVVTHNKGITTDDERVFSASFNTSNVAPNSPFQIEVLNDGGQTSTAEAAEPLLKRSGYVLDVVNARWYRVRNYQEAVVTVGSVTGPGYIVDLETPVVANAVTGVAMFLPGVVDVYPMGSVPIPQ
jgi:prepilin-type N-terminal cleavage/methylation domain-containing protein